ncbi:vWA domain-containing protein, partial [Flavobacterium sp. HTF]|uniref:vWA domain-containing protein n=1 Tax=Flavobacterium sp. HTF TaxID=2170732 RepID=UPI000D5D8586
MEKSLLSFSNYLGFIKRIYLVVLLLFYSSFGLAQTITTNKTVTANAGNCGVVNVKLDITGSDPITRNSDVILVIDVSGSMGNTISNDTKTSMDYAKLAAKSFISQASANTNNRIAIVSYTTNAKLEIGLTYLNAAGTTALNAKIDALTATNNTNIQDGIVKAETELETNGRFDCATARSIILLTDGVTNRTGPSGNTTSCNTTSINSTCVTSAINAATNAKTTVKSSVTYNNQIFSVGLFGGIPGNINTVGSDQYVAKYTLDGIQGSAAYITQSGANLTSIYNQIATQISWVAQSLIEKETIIPGFTVGSITTSKGTAALSGQVITWNTDFLNSETITLNYQLTPTGSACGTQTVSTSTLNYKNTACANDSKIITSPTYFVPCTPIITGVLTACGSTTLTASTNASSPTYVWYKDNVEISGQTAATLVATVSGAYKVKVKNGSTNCELTSAASNVTISPAAALTAPANATIAGCGTNAVTGLLYSTSGTNITLAQLNAAGGSLPNSASIGTYTISYSDTSTGSCPIVVTRTFKVSTSCGNITANQTITIQDTTAPTWTTAPTALNVTLQCSDTAGLATAQNQSPIATDNCGGTVTYTKTNGVFTAGSCINSGTYTNTWIAKDVCNNSSTSFIQVITIQDTTAPTWTTASTALNMTLQCSDTAGLATAQNQSPVATDNCGGTVTYTKTSGVFTAGSCINSGTYTNTWIAKDVCNNSSTSFIQVITIQDTTAPTWTTAPTALNVTLQCSDTAGLATAQNQSPIATDNCSAVTYTKTSGIFIAGSCVNSGTYTNTWIANDVCNNSSTSFIQVITIQDTNAPTWTTAPTALNVTLQCSDTAGLATAQNQSPVATDNCGGTVTYTKTSGVFTAGSCVNSGTYTNTWIAKDVCNNSSTTFTQIITIEDTTAPGWTTQFGALDVTLQCSDTEGLATAQNQSPVATDNCGGTITYTKTSGIFTAGSCVNSGTYTNTWIAKDICNNSSTTFTQVITIQDTNAPTWTTAPTALNVTLQCSDTAGLATTQNQSPVATDNCGGTVTYTKTSGIFTADSCINSGTYTNTWIAKDICNNSSTTFTQVITIQDTTAPIWTTASTALNTTLQCSDTTGLATAQNQSPVATDNCGGTVTYTKTSGIFTAGSCINSGTYNNTWIANDVCNNSSTTFTQVITIEDNTAPGWTTQSGTLDVTLQCSDTEGLTIAQNQSPVATDNCDGTVTYTKTNGVFTAGSCINSGTYTNTWIANDVCNNSSTVFTQVITIEDTTAPDWTTKSGTLDVTLQCSNTAGLATAQNQSPVATDNCGGTVTYTKTSGIFTAGSCINSGTYTNTWVANDVCNNTSTTFTQIITIEDTTAPDWTTQSGILDITLQCSDTEGLATAQNQSPVATDNCGGTVTYTKTSGIFTAGSCVNSGTYTNTWIANDVCNNTSTSFTQTITIEDTTAPTWTTASTALNVTLQCSDTEGLATAQNQSPVATDNCGGTVTYTKTSGIFTAGSCVNSGTYTNTWIANDVCNNTSTTFTQIITIQDTTAPTWTTASTTLNITLQCSDTAGLTTAQNQSPVATDNCGGTVTYIKTSGIFTAGSCINSGTYTNTWVANDVCNNISTTFTQTITIEDTTAPGWTTQSGTLNVTLQCSDTAGLATAQNQSPVATDNCGGTITYTKTSGIFTAGSCVNSGTYTNTWIANDVCDNSSTVFTQVITIEDTTAPDWTTQSGTLDVTLQCSDTEGFTIAQNQSPIATDNCGGTVTYTKTSGIFTAGSCINLGTYTNTWIAKDVCNNSSTVFTQVITIEDTTAPGWTTQSGTLDVTLQCNDTAGLATAQNQSPVATDNCGGTITYTKTSGIFTAGSCINSGTYTNTWIANDVCNNTTKTFTQTITIEDTTAPDWTTQSGTLDITLQCSDTEGFTIAQNQSPIATDNCGGTITYTKISGELQRGSCGSTGTYTNTWTANDVCNNTSVVFTQVITVQDTAIPTWITEAGKLNITLQCNDIEGLTIAQNQKPVATANCSFVTYTKTSGAFVASESCLNSGSYTNSWIAKDDCGNVTDSFLQVITIEDTTSPTWTTLNGALNVTVQCSDTEALALAQAKFPIANDSCDGDVSDIVKTSGQFVAAEGCANSGSYTNTWMVKDDCGNTSEIFTQVITIEDTTAPTWTTLNGALNVTVQCSDTEVLALAQAKFPIANDYCDGDVSNIVKTSGQFVAAEGCANSGTYTNTWMVKDDCGNTSEIFT